MKIKPLLATLVAFVLALGIAVFGARFAVFQIESRSVAAIYETLTESGYDWAEVTADGLQIRMSGTAPDEASRFRALSEAGKIVDGTRIVDEMAVAQTADIGLPDFSVELLHSGEGLTLIGLVPSSMDRTRFLQDLVRIVGQRPVTDLLQTADFPAPDGWDDALEFGLDALRRSEKAKVSIAPDRVGVTTMAESNEAKARLERLLTTAAPSGIEVALDISAPRPVITPFLFRMVKSPDRVRYIACSVPDEAALKRVKSEAEKLSSVIPICTTGLGVPAPDWIDVVLMGMSSMADVADGTLTLSDLDMTFDAGAEVENFSTVVAEMRRNLPEGYTLTATQEDLEIEAEETPAEFMASLSPDGRVEINGRMASNLDRNSVTTFSRAIFSGTEVDPTIEISDNVPAGWLPTVLAALDALSILDHGAVTVRETGITLSGTSGDRNAESKIAGLLTGRLSDGAQYRIDVEYDKRLDQTLGLPSPQECVDQINGVLQTRQITFDPGSADIDADSRESIEKIAEVMRKCLDIQMEVGGYTDSQGREEMNQSLSQSRAEAVLVALQSRRIPVGNLVATGYGEANPIASNDTPEGREANRRIEFRLLSDEAVTGDEPASENAETEEAETAE
ncbi:OmpA family protein [Palleronia caenipelagi]|uniref:OmpA family protein n=1 Tax=Palleronia caenipelagi TaxID=2489174 RepID=A0A547Q8S1_9RHOB|nr:OmpA family protein [Palleronia caenipelagi]TRD22754.1 OmpA family protein [Palleronia caenipelagi]